MDEPDDRQLLQEYAIGGSEAAFTTLVERRIGLVYSAALRQVRDPHLAEEVTQAVFVILARKARSIPAQAIVSGWLYRTARFAARDALKLRFRRQQHEQQAAQMQTAHVDEPAWEPIAPLLDEAMAQLGEQDRNAVMLRYFEQKSLDEVGRSLGVGNAVAQKRVWRAVDKLRRFFARRGTVLTATAIGGALTANAVHAAPANLIASVATGSAINATAATTSTAAIIKGTLKLMAWTKMKTTAIAGALVLFAVGTATIVIPGWIHLRSVAQNRAAISYTVEGTIVFQPIRDTNDPAPPFPLTSLPPEMVQQLARGYEFQRTNTTPSESRFVVHVKDRSWNISVYPIGDTNADMRALVASFDGTGLFWSPSMEEGGRSPVGIGTLWPFPVPSQSNTGELESVWLAFASGDYFDGITNGSVMGFNHVYLQERGDAELDMVPCQFLLSPAPPFLPDEVNYEVTNSVASKEPGKMERVPLRAPFENGYTNFAFKSSARTNIGELSFPMSFELTQIRPKNTAKTAADLQLYYQVTGTVTNLVVGPWTWADPRRKVMTIDDYRVSPQAEYTRSNQPVPAVDDPIVLAGQAFVKRGPTFDRPPLSKK